MRQRNGSLQGELLYHVAEAIIDGNVGKLIVGTERHRAPVSRGWELLGFDTDRHDVDFTRTTSKKSRMLQQTIPSPFNRRKLL